MTLSNTDSSNDLHAQAYKIYEAKGQSGGEEWVRSEHPELEWKHCEPCENVEPVEGGVCLVCSTPTESANAQSTQVI